MIKELPVVMFCMLALPWMISRFLRAESLIPLVFVQLILGMFIQISGLGVWLETRNFDLQQGALAQALQGMGSFAILVLVAFAGAEISSTDTTTAKVSFVRVSVTGFFATLICGTALGSYLFNTFPELVGHRAGHLIFSLAIGLSLSVTALPVLLAVIQQSPNIRPHTKLLALRSAVLDDVWLWLFMALILSLANEEQSMSNIVLALILYLLSAWFVFKPVLAQLLRKFQITRQTDLMLISICVVLGSSMLTDLMGLHHFLGAFLGGAILPTTATSAWRPALLESVQTLLLPIFFILTGMRLTVDLTDAFLWQLAAVFTCFAIFVKCASVALTCRFSGTAWTEGLLLGVLMQCKGLMELVAINALFEAGIIEQDVFSALAMMAIACTLITVPCVNFLTRK